MVHYVHRLSGLHIFQRRSLGVHLITVDPAVTETQATILVFTQAQLGGIHLMIACIQLSGKGAQG